MSDPVEQGEQMPTVSDEFNRPDGLGAGWGDVKKNTEQGEQGYPESLRGTFTTGHHKHGDEFSEACVQCLRERVRLLEQREKGLWEADRLLNPDQGGEVDVALARYWLRTTYSTSHPNYLTVKQVEALTASPPNEPRK